MKMENMNGAKVSRRSVYENEQKFTESGIAPYLGVMVDEVGKNNKTEKLTRIYAADIIAFPTTEFSRDLNKKLQLLVEDRQPVLKDQDEPFSPNNLTCQQVNKLSSPLNSNYWPGNFGIVAPGIFRSGFPKSEDFPCLQTLRLKTILSLVKKDFSSEFQGFVERNHINHMVIDMTGTKKVPISETMMRNIMSIVLDKSKYPILIHCNQGRHRTGCTIAVLRHVLGWNKKCILEEYREFAAPKERDCDIEYIADFKLATLEHISTTSSKIRSRYSLTNPKTWRMLFLSIVLMIVFTTLRCFKNIGLRT